MADCPPPPSLANGSMQLSGRELRSPLFSVAAYVCDRGFKFETQSNAIVYNETLICGENSEWIGTLTHCEGDLEIVLQFFVHIMVYMLNS